MSKKITGKYYIKKTLAGPYTDVTTAFDGVNILDVTGMTERGKAINVYNEQWLGSNNEDFEITTNNGTIVRENVDITITFVVGRRYATNTANFNEQSVFDSFVDFLTNSDVWIKSLYVGKAVHCVANDKVDPKEIKLHRGTESYILGEIQLHCLEKPTNVTAPTYTPVDTSQAGYSTKNPQALGWYERNGATTEYRTTWDTNPKDGKAYYTLG